MKLRRLIFWKKRSRRRNGSFFFVFYFNNKMFQKLFLIFIFIFVIILIFFKKCSQVAVWKEGRVSSWFGLEYWVGVLILVTVYSFIQFNSIFQEHLKIFHSKYEKLRTIIYVQKSFFYIWMLLRRCCCFCELCYVCWKMLL